MHRARKYGPLHPFRGLSARVPFSTVTRDALVSPASHSTCRSR